MIGTVPAGSKRVEIDPDLDPIDAQLAFVTPDGSRKTFTTKEIVHLYTKVTTASFSIGITPPNPSNKTP